MSRHGTRKDPAAAALGRRAWNGVSRRKRQAINRARALTRWGCRRCGRLRGAHPTGDCARYIGAAKRR